MTTSALNWTPEPQLLQQLTDLAQKRGLSLDVLVTEAILVYLDTQKSQELASESDPLIGLFSGSTGLATQSEAILQQEITPSGWTWK